MKYGINARVYELAFSKMLGDYYRKYYPDVNFRDYRGKLKNPTAQNMRWTGNLPLSRERTSST